MDGWVDSLKMNYRNTKHREAKVKELSFLMIVACFRIAYYNQPFRKYRRPTGTQPSRSSRWDRHHQSHVCLVFLLKRPRIGAPALIKRLIWYLRPCTQNERYFIFCGGRSWEYCGWILQSESNVSMLLSTWSRWCPVHDLASLRWLIRWLHHRNVEFHLWQELGRLWWTTNQFYV